MLRTTDISVGAVVREMGKELGVLGCLQDKEGYCRIEECCIPRRALDEATNAFLTTLDRYTISDLLRPRQALARVPQNRPCRPTLGRGCGTDMIGGTLCPRPAPPIGCVWSQ
jgi:Rrf2 family nitric oxide-sensitive transcriptional repressor